jgi:hypothetical protein
LSNLLQFLKSLVECTISYNVWMFHRELTAKKATYATHIQARKIENETHKIYHLLKRYQVKAKVEKLKIEVDLRNGGQELVFINNSTGSILDKIPLAVPYEKNGTILVNEFGIFTQQGNIHIKGNPLSNISFDCVTVAQIRICEGKWNGSECICKY